MLGFTIDNICFTIDKPELKPIRKYVVYEYEIKKINYETINISYETNGDKVIMLASLVFFFINYKECNKP